MRKAHVLALSLAVASTPALAGLGGLLKAASKAGAHADDVGRAAHGAGYVDDAALVKHGDDAAGTAVVIDSASHGDEGARAAKDDGIAGDVLKEGASAALEAAADDGTAKGTEALEHDKHAARIATMRELAVVALATKDHALGAQIARIREKELGRHERALGVKR